MFQLHYLLSSRCSEDTDVNKARVWLFTQKAREIENIPPTKDALHQHVLRAAYQAGHVWCQALNKIQTLPKPEDFGWRRKNNTWVPRWITQPQASEGCRVIIKCGCLKGCKGRCSCHSDSLGALHYANVVVVTMIRNYITNCCYCEHFC